MDTHQAGDIVRVREGSVYTDAEEYNDVDMGRNFTVISRWYETGILVRPEGETTDDADVWFYADDLEHVDFGV